MWYDTCWMLTSVDRGITLNPPTGGQRRPRSGQIELYANTLSLYDLGKIFYAFLELINFNISVLKWCRRYSAIQRIFSLDLKGVKQVYERELGEEESLAYRANGRKSTHKDQQILMVLFVIDNRWRFVLCFVFSRLNVTNAEVIIFTVAEVINRWRWYNALCNIYCIPFNGVKP